MESVRRLLRVDKKAIGRTPRSNLATYTGFFDHVRKLFAATPAARTRRYTAGRFSFKVAQGRCPTCEGEGFVSVELLFLPSVYAPCSACHGTRYRPQTLEITWQGRNLAEVLDRSVDAACEVFADEAAAMRALTALRDIGLGYLRLGQRPRNCRAARRSVSNWPPSCSARSVATRCTCSTNPPMACIQPMGTACSFSCKRWWKLAQTLVEAGNTVVVVEHDMRVVAQADWVIDIGPGAGDEGGRIVASGPPSAIATATASVTAA